MPTEEGKAIGEDGLTDQQREWNTTRIEDKGQAEVRAREVERRTGEEINDEFKRLKLAQALGLDNEVLASQRAIQALYGLTEYRVSAGIKKYKNLLKKLFDTVDMTGHASEQIPDRGLREALEERFGEAKHLGDRVRLKNPQGVFDGQEAEREVPTLGEAEYILIPGTECVFIFDRNMVVLEKGNRLADLLRSI